MSRLYEYQSKQLLAGFGVPVPAGCVASTVSEAVGIAEKLNSSVIVKAQVLIGGRGKVGATKFADTPEETQVVSEQIFRTFVHGLPVERVLVEKKANVRREFYMAVASNSREKKPICIISSAGGVDIEEVAQKHPESIATYFVDICRGLKDYEARDAIRKLRSVSSGELIALGTLLRRLYEFYRHYDCKLVEINPLAQCEDGKFIALDARVEIDGDALFRQSELNLKRVEDAGRPATLLEVAAGQIDAGDYRGTAHFVQIDPDGKYCKELNKIPIGFDCVGGGAALTTLDELVDLGYMPVNFADTSGNPTGSKLYKITKVILSQPHIRGYIFVSCVSSQQLDNTARGIIKALKELYPKTGGKPNIPMVFCIRGSWDEDAHRLLQEHGIADSPWVAILGRDSTEAEAARRFHELYQQWKNTQDG